MRQNANRFQFSINKPWLKFLRTSDRFTIQEKWTSFRHVHFSLWNILLSLHSFHRLLFHILPFLYFVHPLLLNFSGYISLPWILHLYIFDKSNSTFSRNWNLINKLISSIVYRNRVMINNRNVSKTIGLFHTPNLISFPTPITTYFWIFPFIINRIVLSSFFELLKSTSTQTSFPGRPCSIHPSTAPFLPRISPPRIWIQIICLAWNLNISQTKGRPIDSYPNIKWSYHIIKRNKY